MAVKERIPYNLNIEYSKKEELKSVLKQTKFIDLVYNEAFKSIEHAIENKKKNAPLFEVNETGVYIVINVFEYENSLKSILKYFEDTEQYEICIKVNNLIKSIK
jgi:hypothetical protein